MRRFRVGDGAPFKVLLNFYIKSQRDCRTSVPSSRRHREKDTKSGTGGSVTIQTAAFCGSTLSHSHTVFIKWEGCGHLTLRIFTGRTRGWNDVNISQDANLSERESPWCNMYHDILDKRQIEELAFRKRRWNFEVVHKSWVGAC